MFIDFVECEGKDAESIEKVIVEKLEEDRLDLTDCRSQCYDNASVMSGHVSGVQERILQRNPKALYLNCDNHSLNLVGVHAVCDHVPAVTFFGLVQSLFTYFSRSTQRWEKLKTNTGVSLKREVETRWSARYEACKVLLSKINEIVDLLEAMRDDNSNNADTRSDADQLHHRILTFSFLTMLSFWEKVLGWIDRVQKRLQDKTMNFKEAAADIKALQRRITEEREAVCEAAINFGKEKCEEWGLQINNRRRRRTRMPGEQSEDEGLPTVDEMKRTLLSIMDHLTMEMTGRIERLGALDRSFGFLLSIGHLLNTDDELSTQCKITGEFFDTNIDGDELCRDILDCQMLLKKRNNTDTIQPTTPLELLRFVISYGEDVFPSLQAALRILLTIAVSVASCERSFSKLKLIKTHLRTSMNEERLTNLATMSIK